MPCVLIMVIAVLRMLCQLVLVCEPVCNVSLSLSFSGNDPMPGIVCGMCSHYRAAHRMCAEGA